MFPGSNSRTRPSGCIGSAPSEHWKLDPSRPFKAARFGFAWEPFKASNNTRSSTTDDDDAAAALVSRPGRIVIRGKEISQHSKRFPCSRIDHWRGLEESLWQDIRFELNFCVFVGSPFHFSLTSCLFVKRETMLVVVVVVVCSFISIPKVPDGEQSNIPNDTLATYFSFLQPVALYWLTCWQ